MKLQLLFLLLLVAPALVRVLSGDADRPARSVAEAPGASAATTSRKPQPADPKADATLHTNVPAPLCTQPGAQLTNSIAAPAR